MQVATDRDFGITTLRWAAMQAGIGIVRKNNFFYTERGSYQYLEAFLIDAPLRYINENHIIKEACNDEYAQVRDMAKWMLDEIQKKSNGEIS